MATLDQAIQQMLADGMPPFPDGVPRLDTNRVIRYGPKRTAWYRLFEFLARNNKRYISGAYGIWGRLDSTKIRSDFEGMHEDERERLQRSMAELERREREKRALKASFAANRAKQQWDAARAKLPDGVECAYLQRKGVSPEKGLRFFKDGTLLVPMLRYDVTEDQEKDPSYIGPKRLVGVQKIAPDGTKRFHAGMAKEGALCRLGKAKDGDVLLIAEGLATALTLREAVAQKHAVFVAFDAYNLAPAAKILRAMYPKSTLIFCADDDWKTEGNPGQTRANAAAEAVGNACSVWPVFLNLAKIDGTVGRGEKETDFNDLAACAGLLAVAAQLDPVLTYAAKGASTPNDGPAPSKVDGGGKGAKDDVEWSTFWTLQERFTLIYPSDTAYDHELSDIVALAHMRHKFGSRYVNLWLNSKKRRDVNLIDVVFDPSGKAKPHQLNLFRGFAVKPSVEGSCAKLLELLHYLCGEDPEDTQTPITNWLLKWLAYPLQYPGAKMQTALVVAGREGTGKNLFFGAVRSIYGTHGGLITQRQLESQFNPWLSAKLFLVANEVVTRQEMRHNVGFLKSLITENEIWINRKQKDERFEENHCNLVFLSNEQQPQHVGMDDRRYLVIRTPGPRDKAFYTAVAAEAAAGGVAALYQHLLELDLGEFNEHTKPIETAAKRELVELGMASPQLLWQDLHDDELGIPYCPARVEDLYRVYQIWCRRNGVKMPAQINRFIPDFMSMNGVKRRVMRVPDIEQMGEAITTGPERQRKVLLMGDPPQDIEVGHWVKTCVVKFFEAAAKYWEGKS